jgi:hypothetical protein
MMSLYVYAILPAGIELPADLRGFHEAPLELVGLADVASVVVQQAEEVPPPTPERVTAHHNVVSYLRELGPALPVRYGTVLGSADSVLKALTEQHTQLLSDIARLAGKVEYGITALWSDAPNGMPEPVSVDAKSEESGMSYMRQRLT